MKISRSDLENKTCGLRNQAALRLEFEMLNKKFIEPYTCKKTTMLFFIYSKNSPNMMSK